MKGKNTKLGKKYYIYTAHLLLKTRGLATCLFSTITLVQQRKIKNRGRDVLPTTGLDLSPASLESTNSNIFPEIQEIVNNYTLIDKLILYFQITLISSGKMKFKLNGLFRGKSLLVLCDPTEVLQV